VLVGFGGEGGAHSPIPKPHHLQRENGSSVARFADLKNELDLIPHQIVERDADGRKVLQVKIAGHEYTPEETNPR